MNNTKKLALAGFCALLCGLSLASGAATLGERHAAKGISLNEAVTTQQCMACHGSLAAISEKIHKRGNAQSPDPHVNHSIGLNCDECHRISEPSVNMCSRCHIFKYTVP